MRSPRNYRLSAFFALALLILNGVTLAFGSLGTWVCPDNRVCPFMNGQKVAQANEASPSPPHGHARKCCHCPGTASPPVAAESNGPCRFVPAERHDEPARVTVPESASPKISLSALLPATVADLLSAFHVSQPEFPPVGNVLLPPSPVPPSAPSRAPPHG